MWTRIKKWWKNQSRYQINLTVDERGAEAIADLAMYFNTTSPADVIRRSLALARICARAAEDDGNVTFIDKTGSHNIINLRR